LVREGINWEEAVLQGFFGFVLGGILTTVLFAYQPQLLGDVRAGLHDLRMAGDRGNDARSERAYDNRDYGDSERQRDRNGRNRYDNARDPNNDQAPPPGGNNSRT
jgi:hypothetical protein